MVRSNSGGVTGALPPPYKLSRSAPAPVSLKCALFCLGLPLATGVNLVLPSGLRPRIRVHQYRHRESQRNIAGAKTPPPKPLPRLMAVSTSLSKRSTTNNCAESPGPKSGERQRINPTINPPQIGTQAKVQAPKPQLPPSGLLA